MHKIQRASFFFRILFQTIFCLLPVLLVIFWITAPTPLGFPAHGFFISFIPDTLQFHAPSYVTDVVALPLSNTTKFLGFLVTLIPVLVAESILYFLIRLFRLYERGEIFALQNVTYFKKIAYALLIRQALDPIYQALITATLSWHNPVGKRFIGISFTGTNISVILIALLIILISWIMAEGCRLREEQQYTV